MTVMEMDSHFVVELRREKNEMNKELVADKKKNNRTLKLNLKIKIRIAKQRAGKRELISLI